MSSINSGLWERLHKGLEKLAADKHCDDIGMVKLTIAVIISAGRDRDLVYLKGDQFLYHCYLAGMNSEYILKMLERAWYYIDNNIPIELEQKEGEDIDEN